MDISDDEFDSEELQQGQGDDGSTVKSQQSNKNGLKIVRLFCEIFIKINEEIRLLLMLNHSEFLELRLI